jgi:hypothetical protein
MIDLIKEAFDTSWILGILLTILILFLTILGISLTLTAIDYCTGDKHSYRGTVIDASYSPELNSTGTGTAVVNGRVGIVTTHHHQPEKWQLMVRNEAGKVVEVECNPTAYYNYKHGSPIIYTAVTGSFTDNIYSPETLEE